MCEEALRVTRCDWAMRRVIEGGRRGARRSVRSELERGVRGGSGGERT